jgi:hypothetical protein
MDSSGLGCDYGESIIPQFHYSNPQVHPQPRKVAGTSPLLPARLPVTCGLPHSLFSLPAASAHSSSHSHSPLPIASWSSLSAASCSPVLPIAYLFLGGRVIPSPAGRFVLLPADSPVLGPTDLLVLPTPTDRLVRGQTQPCHTVEPERVRLQRARRGHGSGSGQTSLMHFCSGRRSSRSRSRKIWRQGGYVRVNGV